MIGIYNDTQDVGWFYDGSCIRLSHLRFKCRNDCSAMKFGISKILAHQIENLMQFKARAVGSKNFVGR